MPRIVLTGGPGAGKTATLELIRRSFPTGVSMVPEAAGIIFGGGFPRLATVAGRRAAQRAIFQVQRELEAIAEAEHASLTVCDRGTVDGAAYWPGPDDFWQALGTARGEELARYDLVIHLRTPPADNGYNQDSRVRTESADEAAVLDLRIAAAWDGHPRRIFVESNADFLAKATRVLAIISEEFRRAQGYSLAAPGSAPAIVGEPQRSRALSLAATLPCGEGTRLPCVISPPLSPRSR